MARIAFEVRPSRAQLQDLPQQNQRGDHRRRFEVDGHFAVGPAKRLRKNSRRNCRGQAVEVCSARAHGDQREHIQPQRNDRFPAALEKGPAAPQNYRRGQRQFRPIARTERPLSQRRKPGHLPHRNQQQRQRERAAHPESPGHILQLFAGLLFRRECARLQRHAANGARPGRPRHNFRMHGTRVLRARRRGARLRHARSRRSLNRPRSRRGRDDGQARARRRGPRLQIFFRGRFEFCRASRATEKVSAAAVLKFCASRRGINLHPANGVFLHYFLLRLLVSHRLARFRLAPTNCHIGSPLSLSFVDDPTISSASPRRRELSPSGKPAIASGPALL